MSPLTKAINESGFTLTDRERDIAEHFFKRGRGYEYNYQLEWAEENRKKAKAKFDNLFKKTGQPKGK